MRQLCAFNNLLNKNYDKEMSVDNFNYPGLSIIIVDHVDTKSAVVPSCIFPQFVCPSCLAV